jgi:hypothetical protein
MDNATRKVKAEQLAALMNELDVSVWKGVLSFAGDELPSGLHKQERVILVPNQNGTTWKYDK